MGFFDTLAALPGQVGQTFSNATNPASLLKLKQVAQALDQAKRVKEAEAAKAAAKAAEQKPVQGPKQQSPSDALHSALAASLSKAKYPNTSLSTPTNDTTPYPNIPMSPAPYKQVIQGAQQLPGQIARGVAITGLKGAQAAIQLIQGAKEAGENTATDIQNKGVMEGLKSNAAPAFKSTVFDPIMFALGNGPALGFTGATEIAKQIPATAGAANLIDTGLSKAGEIGKGGTLAVIDKLLPNLGKANRDAIAAMGEGGAQIIAAALGMGVAHGGIKGAKGAIDIAKSSEGRQAFGDSLVKSYGPEAATLNSGVNPIKPITDIINAVKEARGAITKATTGNAKSGGEQAFNNFQEQAKQDKSQADSTANNVRDTTLATESVNTGRRLKTWVTNKLDPVKNLPEVFQKAHLERSSDLLIAKEKANQAAAASKGVIDALIPKANELSNGKLNNARSNVGGVLYYVRAVSV